MEEKQNTVVHIRISERLKNILTKKASEVSRTLGGFIRSILEKEAK